MPATTILALLALLGLAATLTQEPAPPPAHSDLVVNVRDVDINALVRDPDGKLVTGLTRDDFTLKQDDVEIPIHYFNGDHDLPLTLGLMVDTSGSQRDNIPDEVHSSEIFLRSMLTRDVDTAFVVRFDSDVTLLSAATANVDHLRAALGHLTDKHPPRAPQPGERRPPGTLLYDAIAATAQQVASKAPGRRALIILTDGIDHGSNIWLQMAIAQSQQADTTVYVILYPNIETYYIKQRIADFQKYMAEHHPDSKMPVPFDLPSDAMQSLAQKTGGRVFLVKKKQSIESVYTEISQELRSQYRIGYVPPSARSGSYHSIQLTPHDAKLRVQARTGYYAP
jgi:VWFA-related protein